MTPDQLADALAHWADGLSPATRRQLSTYDLAALYDRVSASLAQRTLAEGLRHWVRQLSPAAQEALSSYDLAALTERLQVAPPRVMGTVEMARLDPTALGPPARPEHARDGGFTGDACRACGSMAMVRSGTCITCQACGTTTGCS